MLEPPDVGTVSLHLSPFDVFFRDKLRSQVDRTTKTWVTDGLFPQFAVLWLFGEVLGIIMVGTGVLMSQLLVEYVLDTSQDLDKRLWVYVLCLQIFGRNCCRNVSTLWISRFVHISHFHWSTMSTWSQDRGVHVECLHLRSTMALLWKPRIRSLKPHSVAPGHCWHGIWFETSVSGVSAARSFTLQCYIFLHFLAMWF